MNSIPSNMLILPKLILSVLFTIQQEQYRYGSKAELIEAVHWLTTEADW